MSSRKNINSVLDLEHPSERRARKSRSKKMVFLAEIGEYVPSAHISVANQVFKEINSPKFRNYTHGKKSTKDSGCTGPLCMKAARDYARDYQRRRAAEIAKTKQLKQSEPGPKAANQKTANQKAANQKATSQRITKIRELDPLLDALREYYLQQRKLNLPPFTPTYASSVLAQRTPAQTLQARMHLLSRSPVVGKTGRGD